MFATARINYRYLEIPDSVAFEVITIINKILLRKEVLIMKKSIKKVLATILTLVMTISVIPTTTNASYYYYENNEEDKEEVKARLDRSYYDEKYGEEVQISDKNKKRMCKMIDDRLTGGIVMMREHGYSVNKKNTFFVDFSKWKRRQFFLIYSNCRHLKAYNNSNKASRDLFGMADKDGVETDYTNAGLHFPGDDYDYWPYSTDLYTVMSPNKKDYYAWANVYLDNEDGSSIAVHGAIIHFVKNKKSTYKWIVKDMTLTPSIVLFPDENDEYTVRFTYYPEEEEEFDPDKEYVNENGDIVDWLGIPFGPSPTRDPNEEEEEDPDMWRNPEQRPTSDRGEYPSEEVDDESNEHNPYENAPQTDGSGDESNERNPYENQPTTDGSGDESNERNPYENQKPIDGSGDESHETNPYANQPSADGSGDESHETNPFGNLPTIDGSGDESHETNPFTNLPVVDDDDESHETNPFGF